MSEFKVGKRSLKLFQRQALIFPRWAHSSRCCCSGHVGVGVVLPSSRLSTSLCSLHAISTANNLNRYLVPNHTFHSPWYRKWEHSRGRRWSRTRGGQFRGEPVPYFSCRRFQELSNGRIASNEERLSEVSCKQEDRPWEESLRTGYAIRHRNLVGNLHTPTN